MPTWWLLDCIDEDSMWTVVLWVNGSCTKLRFIKFVKKISWRCWFDFFFFFFFQLSAQVELLWFTLVTDFTLEKKLKIFTWARGYPSENIILSSDNWKDNLTPVIVLAGWSTEKTVEKREVISYNFALITICSNFKFITSLKTWPWVQLLSC